MKSYTLFKLYLSSLVLFLTVATEAATLRCEAFFVEARQTLTQYKSAAREKSVSVLPKYSNPQHEIIAAKTWKGVRGPEITQAMLPDGITLIDHALIGANEDGVVKTSTGNMVHVRARRGQTGTNMGVNLAALKDNLNRDKKSLVRESADAVLVFIHGGGTKTTGHHVAASLTNWLNVRNADVVAMDMPWHGEGERNSSESVRESLENMREYVQQYIAPSGKPIILVGHSMGGVVADLYMRMFPKDKLFSAVIPLSPVADAAPGASVREKLIQAAVIEEKNRTNLLIPESERNLGEGLSRQNKISPTCGMYCQFLIMGIDWLTPAHKGQDYLPALYVIGKGDGLYQGYEKAFAAANQLAHAEVKLIDQRADLKDKEGKLSSIGHLIFDHGPRIDFVADLPQATKQSILARTIKEPEFNQLRAEGKIKLDPAYKFEDIAEPETFVMIKNFISKVIGKPLERIKMESTPLELVTQAYANNLAFREFAKTYVFQSMRATERTAVLREEQARLKQSVSHYSDLKKEKKGQLSEVEQASLENASARFAEISLILNQKGLVSAQNAGRYKELQEKMSVVSSATQQLTNERKQLRSSLDEKKKAIHRSNKTIAEFEKSLNSPRLRQVFEIKERAFEVMMKQDETVRNLTNKYLFDSYSKGKFKKDLFENLPQSIVNEFEKYEVKADAYQKILRQFESIFMEEARAGRLIFTREYADVKEGDQIIRLNPEQVQRRVHEAALKANQTEREMINLVNGLDVIEKELTANANQAFAVEKERAQLVGSDYFVTEYYTVEQLLSQSVEAARTNKDGMSSLLQRMWADWQKIWSVRITEVSESLY